MCLLIAGACCAAESLEKLPAPHLYPADQLTSIPSPAEYPDECSAAGLEMAPGKIQLRGINSIRIETADADDAESAADHLLVFFQDQSISLTAPPGGFPQATAIFYDLNPLSAFFSSMPIDYWDDITFALESPDNLILSNVNIVHNQRLIANWTGSIELADPNHSRWSLADIIRNTKRLQLPGSPNGIALCAVMELGKNDGNKYSEEFPGGWCSEFASWVFRRNGWNTPAGSIGSDDLRGYFEARSRLYAAEDIYSQRYMLRMGDYLSFWNGSHSGIFLAYIDDPAQPGAATRVWTIEGGGTVSIFQRTLADFDHAGCAQ
jgi:hypothetical protein